jgi:hypothetical protein
MIKQVRKHKKTVTQSEYPQRWIKETESSQLILVKGFRLFDNVNIAVREVFIIGRRR